MAYRNNMPGPLLNEVLAQWRDVRAAYPDTDLDVITAWYDHNSAAGRKITRLGGRYASGSSKTLVLWAQVALKCELGHEATADYHGIVIPTIDALAHGKDIPTHVIELVEQRTKIELTRKTPDRKQRTTTRDTRSETRSQSVESLATVKPLPVQHTPGSSGDLVPVTVYFPAGTSVRTGTPRHTIVYTRRRA